MPRALSAATFSAASACTRAAIAAPSMICPTPGSASKIHRPRLSNQHDLDLSRILELRFDAPRDLLRHRRHPDVVDVVRQHDDAHFAAGLNGEHLLHALVA